MMRQRLTSRLGGERGFTLVEVLVVIIIIGILAAIALAVLLNQQQKGHDASAKSNLTNLVHMVDACGTSASPDFRDCETAADLGAEIPIDPTVATEPSSDCSDTDPGLVAVGKARVAEAGQNCFVVVAGSGSGNKFWYVRHNDGHTLRDCNTRGVGGCPTGGTWAG